MIIIAWAFNLIWSVSARDMDLQQLINSGCSDHLGIQIRIGCCDSISEEESYTLTKQAMKNTKLEEYEKIKWKL